MTRTDINLLDDPTLTFKQRIKDMQDIVKDIRDTHQWQPEYEGDKDQQIVIALSGIMIILEEIEKKLTK
jgi:hypothetical protein